MSWDSYVDSMKATGHVQSGALLGIDGSIWAKDPDFALSPEEAVAIAGGMGEASGQYFQDNGCTLGGTKYFTLRMNSEEGLYYGKKGSTGCTIARSTQCLIVGCYGEGVTAGQCNIAVEGIKVHDTHPRAWLCCDTHTHRTTWSAPVTETAQEHECLILLHCY